MLVKLLSKCQTISSSLQEKFLQLKAEASSKVEDMSCFNDGDSNIGTFVLTLGVDGRAVYCST